MSSHFIESLPSMDRVLLRGDGVNQINTPQAVLAHLARTDPTALAIFGRQTPENIGKILSRVRDVAGMDHVRALIAGILALKEFKHTDITSGDFTKFQKGLTRVMEELDASHSEAQ